MGVPYMIRNLLVAASVVVVLLSTQAIAAEPLPLAQGIRLLGTCEVLADEANAGIRVVRLMGRQGSCLVDEEQAPASEYQLLAYVIRLTDRQFTWQPAEGRVAYQDVAGRPQFLTPAETDRLIATMWAIRNGRLVPRPAKPQPAQINLNQNAPPANVPVNIDSNSGSAQPGANPASH